MRRRRPRPRRSPAPSRRRRDAAPAPRSRRSPDRGWPRRRRRPIRRRRGSGQRAAWDRRACRASGSGFCLAQWKARNSCPLLACQRGRDALLFRYANNLRQAGSSATGADLDGTRSNRRKVGPCGAAPCTGGRASFSRERRRRGRRSRSARGERPCAMRAASITNAFCRARRLAGSWLGRHRTGIIDRANRRHRRCSAAPSPSACHCETGRPR